MNIKFEVIRDCDGVVDGYKLGDWYLMKHYYWDNNYSWIINKTGKSVYSYYEWDMEYRNGNVEVVNSCKQGKEILKNRYVGV